MRMGMVMMQVQVMEDAAPALGFGQYTCKVCGEKHGSDEAEYWCTKKEEDEND